MFLNRNEKIIIFKYFVLISSEIGLNQQNIKGVGVGAGYIYGLE